jgi:type I restriction enzyme M protein
MVYQLDDNGIMATVMPHGVLFRSGAEAHIRKFLIKEKNYLDAIIGLPDNIFFGTGIPTCIMVFRKCRENADNILFIDASQDFDNAKKQYRLREQDVDKIISTYRERTVVPKYSYLATIDEIEENNFNLNIPRYVNIFDPEPPTNLENVTAALNEAYTSQQQYDGKLAEIAAELGIAPPMGTNLPLLKTYKKGVMQKLLDQEIRFKSPEGKHYESWNELEIGEIFEQRTERYKEGLELLSVTINDGVKKRSEINTKDNSSTNKDNYKRVYGNDIVYNSMRMWQGASGVSPLDGVVSPAYTVLKANSNHSSYFFGYLFKLKRMINTFQRYSQGLTSDTWNLKYPQLAKIKVTIPEFEEQQRIAEFLLLLDSKIECIQKEARE